MNKPITAWYYDYYEPGSFPHQQKLCEEVAWTCGLEGQKRKSETVLSAPIANPLTLRLRSFSKALDKLKREVREVNNSIKRATNTQLEKVKHFEMGITFHSQDSHLKTEGAPIEEIELYADKADKLYFYHKNVHSALYDYFTNLGSVLDRLAYELNMFYKLGKWIEENLDWNKLVNPKKQRLLTHLIEKDDNLGMFIKEKSNSFEKVSDYRNRLIHDGVISTKIDLEGFPRKFHVCLPHTPRDPNSPQDEDAIDYCKILKANLLILLDGSYKRILEHINTHGKPPW